MYSNGNSTTGTLTGFALQIDLGREKALNVTITIVQVVDNNAPLYTRWTGSLTGRVTGGEFITGGVAIFEEFDLI